MSKASSLNCGTTRLTPRPFVPPVFDRLHYAKTVTAKTEAEVLLQGHWKEVRNGQTVHTWQQLRMLCIIELQLQTGGYNAKFLCSVLHVHN